MILEIYIYFNHVKLLFERPKNLGAFGFKINYGRYVRGRLSWRRGPRRFLPPFRVAESKYIQ